VVDEEDVYERGWRRRWRRRRMCMKGFR